jgi:cytochrome c biogenesis protein CcdA
MTLIALAFLGGVLTIVSPCILPVLPFVFARAGQPFLRSGLPMLVGMAAAFTLVAVAGGEGVVTGQRLYQLVRQSDVAGADHTFEIEFLDPGVQAYTFTFG